MTLFGVTTDPLDERTIQTLERVLHRDVEIVLHYRAADLDVDTFWLAKTMTARRRPLVTWEPHNWSLQDVADGRWDANLQSWAEALHHVQPIYLRPAHEFNGHGWYSWQDNPAAYRAAWRHLRYVFKSRAPNVRFVWCPNVDFGGAPFEKFWPGAAYVDLVGLDGYNWGGSQTWSHWQEFTQVFHQNDSYNRLHSLAPTKTIWICETACSPVGGDKAAWVRNMWDAVTAKTLPQLGGLVWFNLNKEQDWRAEPVAEAFYP